MANNSNSTLTTDFNISPYNDDYDQSKQYYRILFKPGYAVQGRELIQLQTMLQKQISRFGSHVFKEGSIVLPGAFNIRTATNGTLDSGPGNPVDYVKISSLDLSNNVIDINDFYQQTITGATSNITAYIIDVLPSDGTTQNTDTLYVSYLGVSPANSSIRVFQEGESLTSNVGTARVLTSANTSNVIGKSSWFQIDSGVFFAKEHFIYFDTQSVVLDRYNSLPSCRVGFYVSEQIVDYRQDISLLDPALESTNYAAPGADRLKLVSDLQVLPLGDTTGAPDFVELFQIKEGIIQTLNERSEYNILGDVFASRTSDESGDYVIKGLTVQINEHLKIDSPTPNYGRFPASGNPAGNSQLLVATVDPGVGYVKGYSVQKFDRTDVSFTKPTEFNNVSEQLSSTVMGNYVRVNELVGTWELNKGNRVQFYDIPQRRITNGGSPTGQKWSTGAQTGNNVGSGIINSLRYFSGTPGYDAVYEVYLSDVRMNGSNAFSNIASLYVSSTPHASSGADIVGIGNTTNAVSNTTLYETARLPLLYYVGNDWVKTVRDTDGDAKTIYFYNKTVGVAATINMANTGTITPSLGLAGNEQIPYGTTSLSGLSDAASLADFVVTMNESVNIGPLWHASVVSNGNTLYGSNTEFTKFNVGDRVEVAGQSGNTWYITAIANNTSMTVNAPVSASVTGNLIFKAYKTGDIINMTGKGITGGVQRTIDTTSSSFTVDVKETFPTTPAVTISFKVGTVTTPEAVKTLRTGRYVKINCSTAGIVGPFNLGFADVYAINSVTLKNGSAPTTTSDGTDVTRYFRLDNGQRDNLYELSSLIKSSGLALSSSDYLLISLDYFEPSFTGAGAYFTVDSYPINDGVTGSTEIRTEQIPVYMSPTTGFRYDLKNYLDFRPVKAPTATDTTTVASATTNPAASTAYVNAASGIKFPTPNELLVYDYSYYLGRRDLVCINKEGSIVVIEGTASENPVAKIPSDSQMILAIVNTTPYPSISPAYGNILNRKYLAASVKKASNRVYTMRDIGVLDQRITNLEYYTSLTLLEKNALNFQIVDENGLNRFKNGLFVDTFRDASLSAAGINPDHRIVTDPRELCIRPLFSTESLGYDYLSGSGVTLHDNNIVTLEYTEVEQYNQPRVSDVRNLERGTFFFQGSMTLFPAQDVWADVTQLPDEYVSIDASNSLLDIEVSGPDAVNQVASISKNLINTEWGNWEANITGYNLYRGDGASKTFVGFFSNADAARQRAAQWTTTQNGGTASLETVYNNTRLGTEYFANFSSDQGAGSNKLISTSSIPYIRPQQVAIKCVNLKGYSKMHVFFDGVNVTEYCSPLSETQFNTYIGGNPVPAGTNGEMPIEGDDLIVDDFGTLHFIFRIPGEAGAPRFRTGQRKLVVIDNTNVNAQTLEATIDTSTSATGIFFAEGTAETVQRTVYSTTGYQTTASPISESFTSRTNQVLPNTWTPPPKGHCCFDPDAKVLMANCTLKAIKDIVEGDEVIGDNGVVNKVIKNKTIGVGHRKMLRLKNSTFYTTDDHLFLTKKGWKTWRPDIVLKDTSHTINAQFLIGNNRIESINKDDYLKAVKVIDGKIHEEFVPYEEIEAEEFVFDPDYVVHDLTLDGNMTYIVDGYVVHNCCVAYSVLIRAPDDEEGIFCTGFNFYVARKSRTRGLWAEIGIMDDTGQVASDRLPGSQVFLTNSQIPVSNTGNDNPVEIRFASPVFLFNKKSYSFIIHSDSPNVFDVDPDTQIWISRLGQTDLITEQPIQNRQGTGQFWQTTNNVNWYEVDDIDLRMEIYRANFTPTTTSFIIGNKPIEKFHLSNQSQTFKSLIGQHFTTGDRITLSGISGSISVGDRIRGNSSTGNANSAVITSLGGNQYQMANSRYVVGEAVTVYDGTGASVATANISAIANSTAVLSYIDEAQTNVYAEFAKSNGGFAQNLNIRLIGTNASAYTANIEFVGDYNYSTVSFQPKALDFVKTDIDYEMDTYNLGATTTAGYQKINEQDTTYFNVEKQIYGRSNEITEIAGERSNKVRVTFNTISNYVSPVLDLNYTQSIFIDNIINANTYGEGLVYDATGNTSNSYSGNTAISGGLAINKYISQTVVLAEGQDAEDLKVIMSCYRPPGTDVIVYAKIMNADDSDIFNNKSWIQLEKEGEGDSTYSSLSDRNNFKDFTYSLPAGIMTAENGAVQYTNSAGTKFTGFKYYAIKIVLTADSPAIIPRASDLRVICLQI